ncbi:hypothetical protein IKO50_06045 [bacterium]|nr:hypothetical protein [bacterium]
MVKKFRIEKWELYYALIIMVAFGFWMGYIFGGSSSWAAKPEARDVLIPNGAMILSFSAIMFLMIKIILYYYRKLELNKKADQLKNSK